MDLNQVFPPSLDTSQTDEKGSRINAKGVGAMRVAWRGQNATEIVLRGLIKGYANLR